MNDEARWKEHAWLIQVLYGKSFLVFADYMDVALDLWAEYCHEKGYKGLVCEDPRAEGWVDADTSEEGLWEGKCDLACSSDGFWYNSWEISCVQLR